MTKFPPCFDSQAEYDEWLKWARESLTFPQARYAGHCFDCTPQYKAIMQRFGRCNFPKTRFYMVGDESDDIGVIGINGTQPSGSYRLRQKYNSLL